MTSAHTPNDTAHAEGHGRAEIASDRLRPAGGATDDSFVSKAPRASAAIGMALGLAAVALAGCAPFGREEEEVVVEVPPIDTVLISDFLRYKLGGEEIEMDRAGTDCYDGLCVTSDGERILFTLPEHITFTGIHHSGTDGYEGLIVNRNGIMLRDLSIGEKVLPDYVGFATDRTITGWGGWGDYVAFDTLYYDYIRDGGPQRITWAQVGGYRSEGNPVGDSMTWKGGATAIDRTDITEDRVLRGNAAVNLKYSERLEGTLLALSITNLTDVESGKGYGGFGWQNIPLRDGGFENRYLRGQFFGPNHEEVGGTFERDMIVGSFGARRVK